MVTVGAAGNIITSSSDVDSTALFGAASLNYLTSLDVFDVSARLGILGIKTRGDSFVDDQGVNVAGFSEPHYQVSLGVRGEYRMEDFIGEGAFTPYLELVYERDRRLRGLGENGLRILIGGNYELSDQVLAGIQFNTLELKTNQDEIGGSATVNVTF